MALRLLMTESASSNPAKHGDPQAVCDWFAQQTNPGFMAIQASRQGQILRLLIDVAAPVDPDQVVSKLQQSLIDLELESTERVQVYGRLPGEVIPQWYREISLELQPSTRQPSRIERARAAEPEAIAAVITYLLRPEGIRSRVHYSRRVGLLQVILVGDEVPDQDSSVARVSQILAKLQLTFVKKLRIAGQKQGSFFPTWSQDLNLSEDPSFWTSVTRSAGETAGAIAKTGAQVSQTVISGVTCASTAIVSAGSQAGTAIVTVGSQASTAIVSAGSQAGQAVVNTTTTVGQAVGTATTVTTETLGSVVHWITSTPYLEHMARSFNVDWLAQLIEQVDVVKAEAYVRHLQEQHPEHTPAQIAHRLMVEKAMFAASTGVVSTLIPGLSLATIALDLAANMALQAEMGYQIAAAYGLDLEDPARKGEVLAIWGISLGGSKALQVGSSYASRAGLSFLKGMPVAGSVIAASTNAALLYALGYGACRYYEAKLDPQASPIALTAYEAAGEKYLATTLTQEQIMDQVLVQVILAGNPGKTRAELLPTLGSANLSPASLAAISSHLEDPPSLEVLLDQLSPDFAVALLVQCRRVAEQDGVITSEEKQILDQIRAKAGALTESMEEFEDLSSLIHSDSTDGSGAIP